MIKKITSLKLNVLLNGIQNTIAYIIPLITFPYITRVLGKGNYGAVTFTASLVGYFSTFAALGLSTYAIREGAGIRNDKVKIQKLASQVFTINIISSFIAYILLLVFLVIWKTKENYKTLILIQSTTIILTTLSADWIYSLFEDFLFTSIRTILFQTISAILVFVFIKQETDYIKYVIITTLAIGSGNLISFFCVKKHIKLKLATNLELKKHLKPILVLFLSAAMTTIYINSDVTILGFISGDEAVGVYHVSNKAYVVVKVLIGSVITAITPRFAYYIGINDKDSYSKLGEKALKSTILLLSPALTGLFMLSSNVIHLFAGNSYLDGVPTLKILTVALAFAVPANFLANTLLVSFKREKILLYATTSSALVNIVLNFFFIPKLSHIGAAITTLIAEILVFVICFVNTKDIFKFNGLLKTIISVILGCFGIVLACLLADKLQLKIVADTIIKIVFSVIFYFVLIFILDKEDIKQITK